MGESLFEDDERRGLIFDEGDDGQVQEEYVQTA